MPTDMPAGFWICLAGLVLGGGVGLALIWRFLRRARLRRVKALAAEESGSTIVEFPFALMLLVVVSLLTWQLGFLVSAYVVVDYAAFAATRSAIVVTAQHRSDDEPQHIVSDIALDGSDKGADVRDAAAFVCYPISGTESGVPVDGLVGDVLNEVLKVPEVADALDDIPGSQFVKRYIYARANTHARIVVAGQESGQRTFVGGQLMTVEVTHDFNLKIMIAARVFGSQRDPEGYVTPIVGRASLLYEGYTEVVPEGVDP